MKPFSPHPWRTRRAWARGPALRLRSAGTEPSPKLAGDDDGTEPQGSAAGPTTQASGNQAVPPPVGASTPFAQEGADDLGPAALARDAPAALARDAPGRELRLGNPPAPTSLLESTTANLESIVTSAAQISDFSTGTQMPAPVDEGNGDMTLRSLVIEQAHTLGSATFLQSWTSQLGVTETLTFATFAMRVEAAADNLAKCGIEPDDRVAVLSHPTTSFYIHSCAVMAMGSACALLNWREPTPTLATMVADSGCAFLMSSDAFSMQVSPALTSRLVPMRVSSHVPPHPLDRRARCRTRPTCSSFCGSRSPQTSRTGSGRRAASCRPWARRARSNAPKAAGRGPALPRRPLLSSACPPRRPPRALSSALGTAIRVPYACRPCCPPFCPPLPSVLPSACPPLALRTALRVPSVALRSALRIALRAPS